MFYLKRTTELSVKLLIHEHDGSTGTNISIFRDGEFIGIKELTSDEANELFESVTMIREIYEEEN